MLATGRRKPVRNRYAYDEAGNLTNQVDAAGRSTTFDHDKLGRRTRRILPGGQVEDLGMIPWAILLPTPNLTG